MSIAATKQLEARAKGSHMLLDKHEHRQGEFGALELAKMDTPNVIPAQQIKTLRTSEVRPVTMPVYNRHTPTIYTDGANCDPEDEDTTSALVGLTWQKKRFNITQISTRFAGNELEKTEDWILQYNSAVRETMVSLSNEVIAVLETERTQVLNNNMGSVIPFDAVSRQLTVGATNAERQQAWSYINAIMAQNNFTGRLNFLHSHGINPIEDFYKNQGAENATNTSYQFGTFNMFRDSQVTPAAGNIGQFYVMPMGSISIVTWTNLQARIGEKQTVGANRLIKPSVQQVEGIGEMACFYHIGCTSDAGYDPGVTIADKETWQYELQYAIVPNYNSAPTTVAGSKVKGVFAA